MSEAVYGLIFSATDQLGNTATATNTLIVADTGPTVDLSVVTTEPFGEVISNTMYFGLGDGAYTITAQVSTPLAGLDTVEFGDATSASRIDSLVGAPSATLTHEYTFTSASTYSSTLTIEATDRAANTKISGIPVIRDIVSPTVNISAQNSGLDITLSWSASDESSGLESCSLTVEVEGGDSQELSTDCSDSMVYPGTQGVAHTFKLTAFDKVFNEATATASTTPNSVTKYYYLGADRVAMRNGDGVFYLHGDHLGSTSLVTDESGELVSETRYYPYGEERFGSGKKSTDFGFTGQRDESSFGLMDYNARLFSPRLGRFISPDSIVPEPGSSSGFNRYRYARNSPLMFTDKTGHYEEDVHHTLTLDIGKRLAESIPGLNVDEALEIATAIAAANQGTDEEPHTTPADLQNAILAKPIENYGQSLKGSPTRYYHFQSRETAEDRLMWAIGHNDVKAFGQALHTYQDVFSHTESGYTMGILNQGVLELIEDCPQCLEGDLTNVITFLRRAFTEMGHYPFTKEATDQFDKDNPSARDTRMINGTTYWITLYLLVNHSDIPDEQKMEYMQSQYGQEPTSWYESTVARHELLAQ